MIASKDRNAYSMLLRSIMNISEPDIAPRIQNRERNREKPLPIQRAYDIVVLEVHVTLGKEALQPTVSSEKNNEDAASQTVSQKKKGSNATTNSAYQKPEVKSGPKIGVHLHQVVGLFPSSCNIY